MSRAHDPARGCRKQIPPPALFARLSHTGYAKSVAQELCRAGPHFASPPSRHLRWLSPPFPFASVGYTPPPPIARIDSHFADHRLFAPSGEWPPLRSKNSHACSSPDIVIRQPLRHRQFRPAFVGDGSNTAVRKREVLMFQGVLIDIAYSYFLLVLVHLVFLRLGRLVNVLWFSSIFLLALANNSPVNLFSIQSIERSMPTLQRTTRVLCVFFIFICIHFLHASLLFP